MFFAPVIGVMKQAENLNDVADKATSRGNLDVPTRSGGNASGTWGISISGNAATVTTVTSSQVANGTAALSAGGVGTYVFAAALGSSTYTIGSTIAGSILSPASTLNSTGTLSGTWRCMGHSEAGGAYATTVWMRIA